MRHIANAAVPKVNQLALPLPLEEREEQALRVAHRSARLRVPFELAMRDRALQICLRCLSEARRRPRQSNKRDKHERGEPYTLALI